MGVGCARAHAGWPQPAVLMKFPRNLYNLPGTPELWYTLKLPFLALFSKVSIYTFNSKIKNTNWFTIGEYELDYYITPVPLVIMILSLSYVLYGVFSSKKIFRRKL